jgi:hypothetical protein
VIRVLLKRHEAVTLVERCRSVVLGVNEHSPPTDFVVSGRTTCQGILQEIATKTHTLDGLIETKARKEDHRDRPLAR